MRIYEKTLELNICAQLSEAIPGQLFWFGLTQKAEARAGFDACVRLRGRLVLLQFKSGSSLRDTRIRFSAKHDQMANLHRQCRYFCRSVFYVLPAVTRTSDLHGNRDLLRRSYLVDVQSIPELVKPSRQSGSHTMYLAANRKMVEIRSKPVLVAAIPLVEMASSQFQRTDGLQGMPGGFDAFWSLTRHLESGAMAVGVPRESVLSK